MTQGAIIVVFAVLGGVGLWALLKKRQEVPSALRERPELPIPDIYRAFYADLGVPLESFDTWWAEIAGALEVPPGRVRPNDRFGVELPFRPVFGSTDEDMFLFGILKRTVGGAAAREALPRLETVDAFIRFLASVRDSEASNRK